MSWPRLFLVPNPFLGPPGQTVCGSGKNRAQNSYMGMD
jgi:hypothetical protein